MRDFRTQYDVFEKLCIAGTELNDPQTAFHEIDRVLARRGPLQAARSTSRFRATWSPSCPRCPHRFQHAHLPSDPEVLAEAVAEAERWLVSCQRPVDRGAASRCTASALQDELLALAEGSQIPITTTMLGKSVISETHPLFVGLYEGAMGNDEVTRFVEESDCVLLLGTFMTDINLGIYTANLDPAKCIYATSEQLRIRHHHLSRRAAARLSSRELAARRPQPPRRDDCRRCPAWPTEKFVLEPDAPIRIPRLIARLNESLDDETIVIADIGDALFRATELVIRGRTEFISPAYYTSMGFSVPAALGAQMARPDLRTVVIVGDGAFQMTGIGAVVAGAAQVSDRSSSCSTTAATAPNGSCTRASSSFNEIQPWAYHKLPEVLGGGTGYEVRTEGDFDAALKQAWDDTTNVSLIHIVLDHDDHSTTLERLTEKLSKHV